MELKNISLSTVLVAVFVFLVGSQSFAQPQKHDTRYANFQTPPDQYGIRCWWWWLNGNITKEAITNDLLEMKAKGFSGACIIDAGGQDQFGNGDVPEGPMFGSDAWRSLYLHALKEADRLGLKLSMSIQSGWNLGGPDVLPDDATKHLTWSEVNVTGPSTEIKIPKPTCRDDYYRDIVVIAFPTREGNKLDPIDNLALKSAFREGDRSGFGVEGLLRDRNGNVADHDVLLNDIVVIKNKISNDVLHWRVPAGAWTIIRFGYTVSDAKVSTASGKWQGRVIDYMDESSFHRYWDKHVLPLLEIAKPYLGKTLQYLQSDSWELGGINWTKRFAEEFRKRRGYEIYPYLAVIAGKIVTSRSNSNAFLADFRKTIGDCVGDYHYKPFAYRANLFGLGLHAESAGPHAGPIDGLKNYSHNAIMMSEFWSPSNHRSTDRERFFVKQAASAARIYNKRLVGAESFTTIGRHWNDVPWRTMKPAFDRSVCEGLNLVFLHTFTCSPAEMGKPGQEYFAGTHLNPNITWWPFAGAFFDYLKRCQYILQNSTPVADVLYYYGDHVPNIGHLKQSDPAGITPGFDYDLINEEQLLKLSTRGGKVILPSGASYHLLVLPEVNTISLPALLTVRQLLEQGAVVVGKKMEDVTSLSFSKEKFNDHVTALWGVKGDSARYIGKGKLINKTTARDKLITLGVPPDIEMPVNGNFDYIHRVMDDSSGGKTDVYFISNQQESSACGTFSFRVQDDAAEIFDPVTGEVFVSDVIQEKGRAKVILNFPPYGSAFVMFSSKSRSGSAAHKIYDHKKTYRTIAQLDHSWKVTFDDQQVSKPIVRFDSLRSWTANEDPQLKYYSGKGIYSTKVVLSKKAGQAYALRLSNVQDVGIAKVWINDQLVAITWTPPFRVDISSAMIDGENEIRVEVINSWRNRLVGDRALIPQERFTKTNITISPSWTLLESGLLGPVVIEVVESNRSKE